MTLFNLIIIDVLNVFKFPKAFGHSKVSILNGGLPEWKSQGFEMVSSLQCKEKEEKNKREFKKINQNDDDDIRYKTKLDSSIMIDYSELLRYLTDFLYPKQYLILDARSPSQ